ncbi:MAG: hypothetical protein NTW96_04715 [Planctomycetia bacterium]|nr:hypothetical protein [Planctomycetia bacterium]
MDQQNKPLNSQEPLPKDSGLNRRKSNRLRFTDLLTGFSSGRMKHQELCDYLSDLFFNAREGVDRFITRSGAPFYKAYRDGVVWFHIHFATNAAEYCAVFKRNACPEFHAAGVTEWNGREQISRAPNRHGGFGTGIVLGSVAQLVKNPKRVTPTEIPSMIWLRPLDDCLIARSQVGNTSGSAVGKSGPSSSVRSIDKDRKLGLPRPARSPSGQLGNGDVKNRSKRNGKLANLNIPLWVGRLADDEAYELVRATRLILKPDSVEIRFDDTVDVPAQLIEFVVSDTEREN